MAKIKQNAYHKMRWIAIGNSIYVQNPDSDNPQQYAVSFNVGNDLAKHIVELHNNSIDPNYWSKILIAKYKESRGL